MAGVPRLGLVLGSAIPPESLPSAAMAAEELGFDELWFSEDCFFTGGVSGATAALSATKGIPVGMGIVSAVTRHPALLAMEIATVARMFPGRFWPGVGLGVPAWLQQMGLLPASPLKAMRESLTALRALLAGETYSRQGELFVFDEVRLSYPAPEPIPLCVGVVGPRMLELAGELADVSVLSIFASPAYIRWARDHIRIGAERANRADDHHRVTAFAMYSVDADPDRARAAIRATAAFYLSTGTNALTDAGGISNELRAMTARGGAAAIEAEMPDTWLDMLTVAGDPQQCVERIRELADAGADSIALFPMPSDATDRILELTAREVLPGLRG